MVFDIKSEIQDTAKAVVAIILLGIPFFLFLLPAPGGREISPAADILLIAAVSSALGASGKTIYFIRREKFPLRTCKIKTARYLFPLYMLLCNTIFTLMLYALLNKVFPHLIPAVSKVGLTGLPGTVTAVGFPVVLMGLTADKLRSGMVKIVGRILKESKNWDCF